MSKKPKNKPSNLNWKIEIFSFSKEDGSRVVSVKSHPEIFKGKEAEERRENLREFSNFCVRILNSITHKNDIVPDIALWFGLEMKKEPKIIIPGS